MLIHIVKTGETIDKIVDSYRILKTDLISNNLHITDFSHLKSGTKLKIPLITKDTLETLEESEAFIDDYYPSFENFLNSNSKIKESINNDIKEVKEQIIVEEVIIEDDQSKTTLEQEEVIEEHSLEKEEKNKIKEESKKYNIPKYNTRYIGNISPKYDPRFIKKI